MHITLILSGVAIVAQCRDAWLEDKCIGFEYRFLNSEELFEPIYALQ